MNILFVCSRNIWRSRTAETIFQNLTQHQVRSAGTSPSARIKINAKHIDWADLIFVMERKHQQQLKERFANHLTTKIILLDIPDEYEYMDEELIDDLKTKVSFHLEQLS